jgi:type IV pilus biogenesis protein CpaD/CtpE
VIVAARTSSRLPLTWSAVLLAAVLLAAGCTSGGKSQGPATTPTSGAAAPAEPLKVQLVTTAKVPPGGLSAGRAARRATPGLERFLDRYLSAAYINAAGGEAGWDGLLGLFDTPVRAAARKQLDALSLGGAAPTVTAVRPSRATAKAVVLYGAKRAEAATVRVSFDGTADTAQGSGPVHLRSVLQLLATRDSWRIAAFDSRTGSAK